MIARRSVPMVSVIQRRLSSFTEVETSTRPDPLMVNYTHAPPDFHPDSAVVYNFFLSKEEGESLAQDVASRMRRRRYEEGHWDAVITGYKEVELPYSSDAADETLPHNSPPALSNTSLHAMKRTKQLLEMNHFNGNILKASMDENQTGDFAVNWLPCHAIDLKEDGKLTAHVDSIRFSGLIVAGLSLLSSSIMRLRPDKSDDGEFDKSMRAGNSCLKEDTLDSGSTTGCESGYVDLFLPPLSLYVLSGVSRFKYTHELLPCGSTFSMANGKSIKVKRGKRVSIIFRDSK